MLPLSGINDSFTYFVFPTFFLIVLEVSRISRFSWHHKASTGSSFSCFQHSDLAECALAESHFGMCVWMPENLEVYKTDIKAVDWHGCGEDVKIGNRSGFIITDPITPSTGWLLVPVQIQRMMIRVWLFLHETFLNVIKWVISYINWKKEKKHISDTITDTLLVAPYINID